MFDRGSQLTIKESVVESVDSVVESADFTAHSRPDLARIGVWVWALLLHKGPLNKSMNHSDERQ